MRGGVLLLSNICLISVGFASWTIGKNTSASADIAVNADGDLIDLNSYFIFDGQPSVTDFCPSGFLSSNPKSGVLTIPFQINTNSSKISEHYFSDSLKLKIVLTSKNNTIANFYTLFDANSFTLKYSNSEDCYTSGTFEQNSSASSAVKKSEHIMEYSFQLNGFQYLESSFVGFLAEINLTFSSSKDFATDFYNKLDENQSLAFSFSAGVEMQA